MVKALSSQTQVCGGVDADAIVDADDAGASEEEEENRLAVVFGNEHRGVSRYIQSKAEHTFWLPTVGFVDSLNLSVACGTYQRQAFQIPLHFQVDFCHNFLSLSPASQKQSQTQRACSTDCLFNRNNHHHVLIVLSRENESAIIASVTRGKVFLPCC